jgi:[acyl-carrier-protein] S-malonyltransferase
MGVELRAASPAAAALFQTSDRTTGLPISRLCADGPLGELTRTDVAQVAVVVTSMAAAVVLEEQLGRRPEVLAVAGHSVGELAAMWWAGALDAETTLHLVHERGRLMARDSAACDGSMAAVLGLDDAAMDSVCATASTKSAGTVQVANLNAPGQVVISGDRAAIATASELARSAGARRVLPLTVGGPFHSVYMEQAARDFRSVVASVDIRRPSTPIVLNTSAKPTTDPDTLREELSSQITSPVHWEASLRTLTQMGCDQFLELGAGQVLTGLVRRTVEGASASAAGTPESLERARHDLGLARLS